MTTQDLDRIEKELDVKLPLAYREFMQSGKFGEGYEGTMDLTGIADEVIEPTKEFRAGGFYGAKWPHNYVVIGDDGAGDCYFTDVDRPEPAVLFADHELTTNKDQLIISKKQQYRTFPEFWDSVRKANAVTDRYFERRRNKRWWQFWIQ